jgi:hypothetical protein
MKKLNMPRKGYYAFSLFPLSMFPGFSFSQAINGILSDENNKSLVGATVMAKAQINVYNR